MKWVFLNCLLYRCILVYSATFLPLWSPLLKHAHYRDPLFNIRKRSVGFGLSVTDHDKMSASGISQLASQDQPDETSPKAMQPSQDDGIEIGLEFHSYSHINAQSALQVKLTQLGPTAIPLPSLPLAKVWPQEN